MMEAAAPVGPHWRAKSHMGLLKVAKGWWGCFDSAATAGGASKRPRNEAFLGPKQVDDTRVRACRLASEINQALGWLRDRETIAAPNVLSAPSSRATCSARERRCRISFALSPEASRSWGLETT